MDKCGYNKQVAGLHLYSFVIYSWCVPVMCSLHFYVERAEPKQEVVSFWGMHPPTDPSAESKLLTNGLQVSTGGGRDLWEIQDGEKNK